MTLLAEPTTRYEQRRERARGRGARFAFAQQPLALYLAIVDAQERAFGRGRTARSGRDALVSYVVRTALPGVMEAAVAAGTETLREATLLRFHEADLEGLIEAWLDGDETSGTDTFLARASTQPVLQALPDPAAALRSSEMP